MRYQALAPDWVAGVESSSPQRFPAVRLGAAKHRPQPPGRNRTMKLKAVDVRKRWPYRTLNGRGSAELRLGGRLISDVQVRRGKGRVAAKFRFEAAFQNPAHRQRALDGIR